jgi:hypothetical protein
MNIYESLKYDGNSSIFKGMNIHEFLSIFISVLEKTAKINISFVFINIYEHS